MEGKEKDEIIFSWIYLIVTFYLSDKDHAIIFTSEKCGAIVATQVYYKALIITHFELSRI